MENLDEPERTLILVYSTEGSLGNGGFKFLFQHKVDKEPIIASYEAIGMPQTTAILRAAFDEFPNGEPHGDFTERLDFIDQRKQHFDDLNCKMWALSDETQECLIAYAKKYNPNLFV